MKVIKETRRTHQIRYLPFDSKLVLKYMYVPYYVFSRKSDT